MKIMKTKKINKIIIYYDDGTFEEIKAGLFNAQSEENKVSPTKSPVIPDFRPDTQKVRDWPQPIYTLQENASHLNKYSITSTGNHT